VRGVCARVSTPAARVRGLFARVSIAKARVRGVCSRVLATNSRESGVEARVLVKAGLVGADGGCVRPLAAWMTEAPMSTRFLPTRESELNNWLNNFSTKVSAAPATYGLSPADAAEIAAAVTDWRKAFETASSPATRTRPAVEAKRERKRTVVGVVRAFAAQVRQDASVSDELKINLGLKLRPRRGSPVPAPRSAPVLALVEVRIGQHELRAGDQETGPRRAKPAGVASLMVFRAVGEEPARSPQDAAYLTLVTRTAFTSTFTRADNGKTATYFARWINTKGEAGPWSLGMTAAVAA
jgi:hypothetical protein